MPAHIVQIEYTEDIAERITDEVQKLERKGERVVQVQPLGHRFLIVTEKRASTQRAAEKRIAKPKETR